MRVENAIITASFVVALFFVTAAVVTLIPTETRIVDMDFDPQTGEYIIYWETTRPYADLAIQLTTVAITVVATGGVIAICIRVNEEYKKIKAKLKEETK